MGLKLKQTRFSIELHQGQSEPEAQSCAIDRQLAGKETSLIVGGHQFHIKGLDICILGDRKIRWISPSFLKDLNFISSHCGKIGPHERYACKLRERASFSRIHSAPMCRDIRHVASAMLRCVRHGFGL